MRLAWEAEIARCSQMLSSVVVVAIAILFGGSALMSHVQGGAHVAEHVDAVQTEEGFIGEVVTDARAEGGPAKTDGKVAPLHLASTEVRLEERSRAAATRRDNRPRSTAGRSRVERERAWDLCLLLVEIARNQPGPWTQQCPGSLVPLAQEPR
jgi:hypothetical protein